MFIYKVAQINPEEDRELRSDLFVSRFKALDFAKDQASKCARKVDNSKVEVFEDIEVYDASLIELYRYDAVRVLDDRGQVIALWEITEVEVRE